MPIKICYNITYCNHYFILKNQLRRTEAQGIKVLEFIYLHMMGKGAFQPNDFQLCLCGEMGILDLSG